MWNKGESGNPHGRHKSKWSLLLDKAIQAEQKKHRRNLIRHIVAEAYEDNTVLVALLRKILPDLKAVDTTLLNAEGDTLQIAVTLTDKRSKVKK